MRMSRRNFIKKTPAAGLGATLAASAVLAADKPPALAAKKNADPVNPPWNVAEEDVEFFHRELSSFLPDCVFDAHAHLYSDYTLNKDMPENVGLSQWRTLSNALHPDRRVSALFIPLPPGNNIERENQWVANHAKTDRSCRGLFFVKPEDDPEWVREEVRRLGLHGLKCYHKFSAKNPTWESDIPDYLPEKFMKPAHEEGWVVTLHMVKSRAVADPRNLHWIRRYCENYPNMKLILAHSARGFQPAHNLEGLPKLTGLDNLYFDTSANCESVAHEAILRIVGHKNLLYGSDTPVSHTRGRSLAAADSFLWLYRDSPVWGADYAQVKPVLVGLEHLRSLKWACWSQNLGDGAVEDIFWNNAARLFGL